MQLTGVRDHHAPQSWVWAAPGVEDPPGGHRARELRGRRLQRRRRPGPRPDRVVGRLAIIGIGLGRVRAGAGDPARGHPHGARGRRFRRRRPRGRAGVRSRGRRGRAAPRRRPRLLRRRGVRAASQDSRDGRRARHEPRRHARPRRRIPTIRGDRRFHGRRPRRLPRARREPRFGECPEHVGRRRGRRRHPRPGRGLRLPGRRRFTWEWRRVAQPSFAVRLPVGVGHEDSPRRPRRQRPPRDRREPRPRGRLGAGPRQRRRRPFPEPENVGFDPDGRCDRGRGLRWQRPRGCRGGELRRQAHLVQGGRQDRRARGERRRAVRDDARAPRHRSRRRRAPRFVGVRLARGRLDPLGVRQRRVPVPAGPVVSRWTPTIRLLRRRPGRRRPR